MTDKIPTEEHDPHLNAALDLCISIRRGDRTILQIGHFEQTKMPCLAEEKALALMALDCAITLLRLYNSNLNQKLN